MRRSIDADVTETVLNKRAHAGLLGLALWVGGAAAFAQVGAPNAFVAAYGPEVQVREVIVAVRDGAFGKPQDNAARSHLNKRMPAAQTAAFQAKQPRLAPDAAGERVAEFVASRLLAKRLRQGEGASAVRVLVDVTAFNMRSSFPLPGSEPLPIGDAKVSFTVRVENFATGRELARAVVQDCVVADFDLEEAKRLAELNYAPIGTDIQFRMVAASMNAVSRYVEAVLEQPNLPSGTAETNSIPLANGALVKTSTRHPLIRLTVQPGM